MSSMVWELSTSKLVKLNELYCCNILPFSPKSCWVVMHTTLAWEQRIKLSLWIESLIDSRGKSEEAFVKSCSI